MNNPYSQDPQGGQPGEPQYATYGQPSGGSNVLGIVGFILALTCLLSPIGLIVSIIALFKRPRGFAIAGTIVGLVLSSVLLLAGGGIWAAVQTGKAGASAGILVVQAQVLEQQINAYTRETGRMPSSLDDVHLPNAAKTDPWGTPYRFNPDTPSSERWTISSAGPDGQFGTNDDIQNIVAFEDNDGTIVRGWVTTAQQNPDDWAGWQEMFRIISEIGTWDSENAGRSAVAGGADPLPPADPADPDPATP